jgi:hypothetical protein
MDISTINFKERLTPEWKESRLMLDGDLWLAGKGLAIQKPTGDAAKMQEIREGFATQNVLEEVSDRQRDGILGREPRYNLVPMDGSEPNESDAKEIEEILAAVVEWWNSRNILDTMREMLTAAHCERRSILRPFASSTAYADGEGLKTLRRDYDTFAEALESLHFEIHRPDAAGVFREEDTLRPVSVFRTKRDEKEVTEVSMVDAAGLTHLTEVPERVASSVDFLTENNLKTLAEYARQQVNRTAENAESEGMQYAPLDLRGHLYLFELDIKKPFISEAMKSLQKQISLILTMDGRNIYSAGIRKEHHLNTERPKEKRIVDGKEVWVDAPLKQGAGVRNFLNGVPVYDERTGALIGRANPSVVIVDPVSSETFIQSADDKRARVLAMASQLHVLLSDSATASGVSRKEARDEFRKSLMNVKSPLDQLGRYIVEFAVMYAANLTGKVELFKRFRCNFDCIVDAGSPSPEEKAENRKSFEAGEISLETLRSLNGAEDTDAEGQKVMAEPQYEINLARQIAEALKDAKDILPLRLMAEIVAEKFNRPEWTPERVYEELSAEKPAPAPDVQGKPENMPPIVKE